MERSHPLSFVLRPDLRVGRVRIVLARVLRFVCCVDVVANYASHVFMYVCTYLCFTHILNK